MNRNINKQIVRSKLAALTVIACLLWGLGLAGQAMDVYTPVGVTASTELSGDSRLAVDTINGSGLAFAVPTNITSIAALPNHNQVAQDMWLTAGTTNGTITFDLGSTKMVDTLLIWNYAEVSNGDTNQTGYLYRSVKNVNIYADNTANPTTFIQSMVFNRANPAPLSPIANFNTPVDAYGLAAPINARYIKFDILGPWNGAGAEGFGYVGLSEVRFAIPEPSAVGLVLCGGLVLWRRLSQRK